jgi:hypothetical protein
VLSRQVLDVLPAARTMQGGAVLVPGVSFYSQGFVSTMSIHGSATADQPIARSVRSAGGLVTGRALGAGSRDRHDRKNPSLLGARL